MANQADIPERRVVARGRRGSVECAVRSNGRAEAWDFLESPECRKYKVPLLALFQKIVDANPDDDEVRPKLLTKTSISEFKKGQVWIFCFRDGDAWVLTHGDLKKTNKTPPNNLTRAETICAEDMELARLRKKRKDGHAAHDG